MIHRSTSQITDYNPSWILTCYFWGGVYLIQKLPLQTVNNLINPVGCAFLQSFLTDQNELLSNQGTFTLFCVPIK